MTTELKVQGMSCQMCVQHVANALRQVPGVSASSVHLQAGTATVQHQNAAVAQMIAAVEEAGYHG